MTEMLLYNDATTSYGKVLLNNPRSMLVEAGHIFFVPRRWAGANVQQRLQDCTTTAHKQPHTSGPKAATELLHSQHERLLSSGTDA